MTTIDLDPKLFLPEPEPRDVRYTVISVDDHLVEPPRHVRGPAARASCRTARRSIVETAEGHEVWTFEGSGTRRSA